MQLPDPRPPWMVHRDIVRQQRAEVVADPALLADYLRGLEKRLERAERTIARLSGRLAQVRRKAKQRATDET